MVISLDILRRVVVVSNSRVTCGIPYNIPYDSSNPVHVRRAHETLPAILSYYCIAETGGWWEYSRMDTEQCRISTHSLGGGSGLERKFMMHRWIMCVSSSFMGSSLHVTGFRVTAFRPRPVKEKWDETRRNTESLSQSNDHKPCSSPCFTSHHESSTCPPL